MILGADRFYGSLQCMFFNLFYFSCLVHNPVIVKMCKINRITVLCLRSWTISTVDIIRCVVV